MWHWQPRAHQPSLNVLPASGTTQLSTSLEAATGHPRHIWRDTPPVNDDGTVNAYIEISRGDRRKWEFDMRANARAIDRVIPEDIGGYPVNYGFVPQTVSYDGDPFDALVLGPSLPGGDVVRGVIVGLMYMEDEKGIDSKVVLSPVGQDGTPALPTDGQGARAKSRSTSESTSVVNLGSSPRCQAGARSPKAAPM